MSYNPDISFLAIHSACKKCTPSQLMSYHMSLHLYKTLAELNDYCTTELARLLVNIVCTRRQISFEIIKTNHSKIGMNSISNKFYHISKLISLNNLNLTFVHFKKIMKIQFTKNGRTQTSTLSIIKPNESWRPVPRDLQISVTCNFL